MPSRPRPFDLCALAAAGLGAVLALDGYRSGSLFRYQLASYALGGVLALPLLSLLLWREAARRVWRRALFAAQGKTREGDLLAKCAANLVRLWAEP